MIVLSLDSAGSGCAACVWQDGQVRSLQTEKMSRGQDARLVPLVLAVLQEAKLGFADVDRIAVTRGPGSFTGLRIGLSAARGFGLAADTPVLGIDRLAIFHAQHAQKQPLLAVLDSRRQDLFCQYKNVDGALHEAQLLTPDAINGLVKDQSDLFIAGDAEDLLKPLLPVTVRFLEATEEEVVTAAVLAAKASLDDPTYAPRPLYLRAPDVTLKASGGCMSFIVRPVVAADAEILAGLHQEGFGAAAWTQAQMAGSLKQETMRGWLGQIKDVNAGFILAQILDQEAEIITFSVSPAFRRQGLGKQLLQQLLTALPPEASLFLEVAEDNAAARALYEGIGFKAIGVRPNYYRHSSTGQTNVNAINYVYKQTVSC